MPNALYQPGLATNIAFWFLNRAHWTREQLWPGAKDATIAEVLLDRYTPEGPGVH